MPKDSKTESAGPRQSAALGGSEYSVYYHPSGYHQLWLGKPLHHPTKMVRMLLPESVRLMERMGLLRSVGISPARILTIPNAPGQPTPGTTQT